VPKPVDITHLRASIARLSEAREQIKLWSEIEREEKLLILDAVAEGIGSISGVPAVTVTDQVRRGLDTTRLKQEYPQIAADFATETSYKVVRVL
jgi:hypothetical protein